MKPGLSAMCGETGINSYRMDDGYRHIRHSFKAFDTLVSLDLWGEEEECKFLCSEIESSCARYESLFSRTIENSDIGRLNLASGTWAPVDPQTSDLIESALGYCESSDGLFDITIGNAVRQWDFKKGEVARERALEDALPHIDWRSLEIDREAGTARSRDPLALVDLGGIAKGWIADRIREHAMRGDRRISGMIANLGGNVILGGSKPECDVWKIGVKDPWNPSRNVAVLETRSGSVVTSGIYERCFERDGILYHHVLDPKTGRPRHTDLASATLVCADSIDAEGFSTTVLALGMDKGSEFVRSRSEIQHACLIGAKGDIRLL